MYIVYQFFRSFIEYIEHMHIGKFLSRNAQRHIAVYELCACNYKKYHQASGIRHYKQASNLLVLYKRSSDI